MGCTLGVQSTKPLPSLGKPITMKNIESERKDKNPPNTTWSINICSTNNDYMNQHTKRQTSQPKDQTSKGIQTKGLLSGIYLLLFLASNSLA